MDWYRIPIECPDCGKTPKVKDLAINAEWKLGLNYTCKCGREGGQQYDLTELVTEAQRTDAFQAQ